MLKFNFNKDWQFTFENNLDAFNHFGHAKYTHAYGAPARYYKFNNWQRIDLPHDWAIALQKDLNANNGAGARANSHYHRSRTEMNSDAKEIYNIGWYRKEFSFNPEWENKRVFIEFEGIFRDATLWVNGVYIDRHCSGYTSFIAEITDHLVKDDINSIAVRVDSDQPEGWFYEGSGIYRNVNLFVGEEAYFSLRKTFVKSDIDGNVSATAVLVNDTDKEYNEQVCWTVSDNLGNTVAETKTEVSIPPYSEKTISADLKVKNPELWHVDTPNLYTLCIGTLNECTEETFGFRSIAFDADKGFFLNGKPLKLYGACVHQDFGGVGIALTDNLNYYKIQKLKEMGVNAYRASHHAPSPAILKACDELGMLVMDETRTFGTSPEATRQLVSLVERDRNHPSVFIWCIGNEEFYVQDLEWSNRLAAKMTRIVKTLDDTRPVTYGGSNGENFEGANGASEIRGINYIRNGEAGWIDKYHLDHPHQPIIGTEESSYVLSHMGTENDLGSCRIDFTGDVTMIWGSTPKGWVKFFEERDFLLGGFMWTGFDYHGEPNPFENGNVSSSFGAIDLCGIEKPVFHYYKAWWTNEPVLKIAPHWNFKEGETAKIRVYTNCDNITLSLNGKSLGTKEVERFDTPIWEIPFEPGTLSASGTKDGKTITDEIKTAKDICEIKCTPVLVGKTAEDTSIIQIDALDKDGTPCPFAENQVELSITDGKIIGVCNGDPACLDYEQKSLTEITKFIRVMNCDGNMITLPSKTPNAAVRRYDFMYTEPKTELFEDDYRLVISNHSETKDKKDYTFTTKILNTENYEYIEFERISGAFQVSLNGKEIAFENDADINRPYRIYCDFQEGDNEIKIKVTTHKPAIGAISGYVKAGKLLDTPWIVRLFNGRARIFVKTSDIHSVKATLI
uniref:glycoside hydrolase family 2 TIM barrel-domain containing protein n=1 Tax=Agathobacter sp. TaxID=2021311 RepID=UPI004055EFC9